MIENNDLEEARNPKRIDAIEDMIQKLIIKISKSQKCNIYLFICQRKKWSISFQKDEKKFGYTLSKHYLKAT